MAKRIVIVLGLCLAILHQDWWFRDNSSLVFEFIPISLFYHLCFSVAVAGLWALMSKFAWPTHIEEFAALGDSPAPAGQPGSTAAVPAADSVPPAGGALP